MVIVLPVLKDYKAIATKSYIHWSNICCSNCSASEDLIMCQVSIN